MKVIGIISLFLACVAARGSGPYLPSGWKPDGPAFYLPSEVSKPSNEPVKEIAFSESEALGSDFLREYGPPKLILEASQDISQQGLPDEVNEKLFTGTVVETNDVKDNSIVVAEVIEHKLSVSTEDKTTEEALITTESESTTATESLMNIDEQGVILSDEYTTTANAEKPLVAVDEFGYLVEPTVAIVIQTETVTPGANTQSEHQILEETVTEILQLTDQPQDSERLVSEVEESDLTHITQITSEILQRNSVTSEQAEVSKENFSEAAVTQQTDLNFDVISADEKKVVTAEEKIKTVEKAVENIPDVRVSLDHEIKSQQAKNIDEVPAFVLENSGSLEQEPEGFLEYGPPGFSEYGPPKEDLKDNTIEENILETQSFEKSERRRRFSPKFRSAPKFY